jgi:hypothetical protein
MLRHLVRLRIIPLELSLLADSMDSGQSTHSWVKHSASTAIG